MKGKYKTVTRLLLLFLSVMFAFAAVPGVFVEAAGDTVRLVDGADLLSASEEAELSDLLNEISERQQVDIVVVTADSLEGESPRDYADDFYDYNDYGFGEEKDGILFLISMEERDWYISTAGYGITAVTDAGLDYMSEEFLPYLSDGEYARAFQIFARQCDDYITQAREGTPYDIDNVPDEPFSPLGTLGIALAAGFVTALIVTGVMRHGLHSVRSQSSADDYVKRDSLRLTKDYELFLYRNVTRRERPKQNTSSGRSGGSTTHVSSSGRSHGGGGGKF
ncbi:MAG: TPM domain-containing protein [Roseburia sp.]|nr:TPM domain-containing protein [Roseburia sp.]